MSWISDNYEKALVGAAVAVLVALVYTGYSNFAQVSEDFSSRSVGRGGEDASVANADQVIIAKQSFDLTRSWNQSLDGGRKVDLFTGVPLFVNKQDLSSPVDLPLSPPVHEPISNKWWIEHRIDPGFADSPARDEDLDGFSNLEEFSAGTDPVDVESHPSLLRKLMYLRDESVKWILRPGYPSGDGGFTFDYGDTAGGRNKTKATDPVAPNDLFFKEGAAQGRFKFIGAVKKQEINERIQAEVEVTIVTIEDQRENKKGTIYEIPAQFRKRLGDKFAHYDRAAIMTLNALGKDGQEIRVDEFDQFALPSDAATKRYKILDVTPELIKISETMESGEIKTYELRKGSMGATDL